MLVEGDDGRGYSADYTPFRVPGGRPGALASAVATASWKAALVVATMCAMSVTDRVQAELRAAMKAGQRTRLDALRLLVSALQRAEKDRPAGEFADRDAEAVLRRERKQRVEAAEAYRGAGHEERAAAEEADLPVIDEFLPQQMDEDELAALVDAAIAETGATSMRDMGRVMGLVTQRAEGRADGKAASDLVRSRLSA